MRNIFQDLRFSLRYFARQPLFTGAAVCSLGLGIGACAIVFSVVYALLLKPLPYRHPEQLVHVGSGNASLGEGSFGGVAPATLNDLRVRTDTGFSALAGMTYDYANLTGVPTPTQLTVGLVTPGYLGIFGVSPFLGRTFSEEDHRANAPLAVVLGDKLWRAQFNANPQILGHSILIGDKPRVVVGVMPASFKEPNNVAELWLPIQTDDSMMLSRTNRSLITVGRVTDGTLEKIHTVLKTVSANLAAADPAVNKGWLLNVEPLGGNLLISKSQNHALWLLLGAVGCVLLVTCANVANLQLARASARRREFGVRLALGAGRGRIMRQALVESVTLAVAGGGLSLLLAAWGVDAVRALLPAGYSPRQEEIALSLPVLEFAIAVAGLTGVVCGLFPAWFASRQDPAGSLAGGGRGAAGGGSGSRTRDLLVIAEISLALVLLAGAGLMGRSFLSLLRTAPGFRTERVMTFGLSLSDTRYPDAARRAEFYRRILTGTRAVPGLENVALTTTDFFNWTMSYRFIKPGQSQDDPVLAKQTADYDAVNPEFFAALDIPLRRGRVFEARDTLAAPPVTVVNEEFVRRFFPGVDPLGQKFTLTETRQSVTLEIVGVTANVLRHGADEAPAAQMYVSYLQRPTTFATLYARASGSAPAESLTRPVQATIWNLDPDQPITNVLTLETARHASVGSTRLYLALFALFAGLTLGLAALGIYGTVAYSVSQRTREIGIRLALGAQRVDVLRLVLRQGSRLILLGLALGMAASLALARLTASLLYGVSANDPVTLVSVAILLGVVALLASYLPARRATRIDPLTALHEE